MRKIVYLIFGGSAVYEEGRILSLTNVSYSIRDANYLTLPAQVEVS